MWPIILGKFDWMELAESGTRLMPYIQHVNSGVKYRVNYCPACGSDRRGIETTTEAIDYSRYGLDL